MGNSKSDQLKQGKIYGWHVYLVVESGNAGFCKIGSAARVSYRIASLQTGNPRRLTLSKSWHLDNREQARSVELAVLKELAGYRLPASEWFQCKPEMVVRAVESAIEGVGASIRTSLEPRWK